MTKLYGTGASAYLCIRLFRRLYEQLPLSLIICYVSLKSRDDCLDVTLDLAVCRWIVGSDFRAFVIDLSIDETK